MTVPSTSRRAGPFLGNDSTTVFSFSFKTFAAGDLLVTKTSASNVETTLTLATDYTVTLNGDQDASPGGTITYPVSGSPLAFGEKLTIIGDLEYEQTTDLLGGGAFNARVIEDTFDRTVIQIQQVEERMDRALLLPVSTSGVSPALPTPEAGLVIGWNTSGTGLQNFTADEVYSLYGNWTYSTFTGNGTTTAFTLSKAPGNIANVDVSIDGVVQVPVADYSLSGAVLTFVSAPPNGSKILARYGLSTTQAFPSYATEQFTATAGQTIFNLTTATYVPGSSNVAVYVNGLRMVSGADYIETNSSRITFTSALTLGDEVSIVFGREFPDGLDSSSVGFAQAGTGAVARTVQAKLRDVVSVKDFGAACDGVTDDWAAIQAAQEYLKANGGGTLYFPGFCRITQVFHFYGAITGGWGQLYPEPNEKMITWASNGMGGIVSTITSGDVLRLSKSVSETLEYKVGFQNFVINCSVNNVTAVNGLSQTGIFGANHHVDIDNLVIHGIEGANAIGIEFGTITDSQVRGLKIQGWGTGPYAGVRIEKTDVQLINCMFVYCRNSVVIGGQLAEACIQAVGCQFLNPKSYHVFWEATAPDSKASASIISASFVGECTHPGSAILGAATPATLDIGSFTFEGCTFDNYRSGQPLWDVTWGGRFSLIGNSFYDAGSGGLSTVKFGQFCFVTQIADGLTIDQTCDSWLLGKVNRFVAGLTSGGGVGLSNTRTYGAGVTFPPTSVPVADPNTLDDYEEGSWTPQLTFATPGDLSVTYGRNAGRYQKIGNTVYVSFTIFASAFTHTTASGDLRVTGLPFTVANNNPNFVSSSAAFEGYTKANYTVVCAETVPGQTYFSFTAYGSGQTLAGLTASDIPSGSRKIIQSQFQYTV